MFQPEYSITTKILNNIAEIEYARAVIDNTPILQTWQNQLTKEAKIENLLAGLQNENINIGYQAVKKVVYDMKRETEPFLLNNFLVSYDSIEELSSNSDLKEADIKYLARISLNELVPRTRISSYRSSYIIQKTKPAEILAELTEFIDWLNTLEAREEHPVLIAAITYFTLLKIAPFETANDWISYLVCMLVLRSKGFHFKYWLSLQDENFKEKQTIIDLTNTVFITNDYTQCLEYYCAQLSTMCVNLADKVKLLAKDTRLAKVSGRAKLTDRQEKIIAYIQDYGILQNKDFPVIFPKISEDSVLRDLKVLQEMGLIIKTGSTKSSRYELK